MGQILEKLIVSYLAKKFPAFYGTWMFTVAITRARHLVPILTQMNPIYVLSLPNYMFSSGLPSKFLHTHTHTHTHTHIYIFCPIFATCPVRPIRLYLITQLICYLGIHTFVIYYHLTLPIKSIRFYWTVCKLGLILENTKHKISFIVFERLLIHHKAVSRAWYTGKKLFFFVWADSPFTLVQNKIVLKFVVVARIF